MTAGRFVSRGGSGLCTGYWSGWYLFFGSRFFQGIGCAVRRGSAGSCIIKNRVREGV